MNGRGLLHKKSVREILSIHYLEKFVYEGHNLVNLFTCSLHFEMTFSLAYHLQKKLML